MSDYITKQEVLKLLTPSDTRISETYIALVREEIKLRPSADVVEVVRCKDCKWWTGIECANRDIDVVDDNDYCSYGERKDDEHK